ncbi:MAG TPA: phosphotransferase [bacterium]|nr:phosphotransferase [bacterium]
MSPGWLERALRSRPFVSTGKSRLYKAVAPGGRKVVVKQLVLHEEPWVSLFRQEILVHREISGPGHPHPFPKLVLSDGRRRWSVWEFVAGQAAGRGRFYASGTTAGQAQAILAAIAWIPAVRRQHPLCFAHGDLIASNLIYAKRRVMLLDWEHSGLRLAGHDLATLWVMAQFAPPLRRAALAEAKRQRLLGPFWRNAAEIASKELRIHAELKPGDPYKSERPLAEIRAGLRRALKRART